jgi:glutamine synthetase
VLALVLAAGLRGVESGYELPPELVDDASGCESLPEDLGAAIELFAESALAHEALGDVLCEWFVRNKRREWAGYCRTVGEYERRPFSGLL